MIRVVVAEDSPTARALLVAMLKSDPSFEVVGEAVDGVEAIELVKALRPDVVTMDIQMPRLDGFEATKTLMIEAPTPIVIISSLDVASTEVSAAALAAGALAVLPKLRSGALLIVDNANWFLPSASRAPSSRGLTDSPLSPTWEQFAIAVSGWEMQWTENGVADTAIWTAP